MPKSKSCDSHHLVQSTITSYLLLHGFTNAVPRCPTLLVIASAEKSKMPWRLARCSMSWYVLRFSWAKKLSQCRQCGFPAASQEAGSEASARADFAGWGRGMWARARAACQQACFDSWQVERRRAELERGRRHATSGSHERELGLWGSLGARRCFGHRDGRLGPSWFKLALSSTISHCCQLKTPDVARLFLDSGRLRGPPSPSARRTTACCLCPLETRNMARAVQEKAVHPQSKKPGDPKEPSPQP